MEICLKVHFSVVILLIGWCFTSYMYYFDHIAAILTRITPPPPPPIPRPKKTFTNFHFNRG